AYVLVRFHWQHLPLQNRDGTPFDLFAALRRLAPGEVGDFAVQTAEDSKQEIPAIPGRVVAVRKSAAAAQRARRKVWAEAKKKGRTPDARTLESCDYLFVFTTLPPSLLNAGEVLEL